MRTVLLACVVLFAGCVLWPRRHRGRNPYPRSRAWRRGAGRPADGPVDRDGAVQGWVSVLHRVPGSSVVVGRFRASTGWVADFAEGVTIGLEAGLSLEAACRVAASSPSVARAAPWLSTCLAEAQERGDGVAETLSAVARSGRGGPGPARAPDVADLAALIAAWRLSEHVGAPAAAVTATAARSVRDRREARDRLEVASSGPRTSMMLLSALPLLGPLGGAAAGVGPMRLYAGVAGAGSLVTGCVLTLVGWWWARSLLRRACLPALTGPGPGGRSPGSLRSRR